VIRNTKPEYSPFLATDAYTTPTSTMFSSDKTQTARAEALGFDALYFDTDVLIANNWPAPSLALENLLLLAVWARVACFVPEPVLQQAEEHWLRGALDRGSRLRSAAQEFVRITRQVGGCAKAEHEDAEVLRIRFREAVQDSTKRFGISITPFTTRPTTELFDLAVRYVLPFEQGTKNNRGEGKGFQDAVILESILEHVNSHGLSGAFVTNDKIFFDVQLEKFIPAFAGVELQILSWEKASEMLFSNYWNEHIKGPWEEETQNAMQAVKAIEPELREFIKSNMTDDLLKQGATKEAVRLLDVQSVDVFLVATPIPDLNNPDRSIRLAISVYATCRILTNGDASYRMMAALLAGRPYESDPGPGPVEMTTKWTGGIEGTAEVKNRQITNISLTSLLSTDQFIESHSRIMDTRTS
jgi:hypothetical protein